MKTIFSPEYDIFRQCMIAARKAAKLTQATLAQSLNKPQSFVAKYENGERRLDVIEFLLITRWFPLATEITARFKDSQNHFQFDQTYVAILAWLPENIIYGKPRIIDVCVVSGLSVAAARDNHYHNPPDYLVLEPEDTTQRTANLQQTNTNGYKFQGSAEELLAAQKIVELWGSEGRIYKPTREYQLLLRELLIRYKYRLDTNFAKMDRIVHPGIEQFKQRVFNIEMCGMKIGQWNRLLSSRKEERIKQALQSYLDIKEESIDKILD